jgi:ERCC4-type nuclease
MTCVGGVTDPGEISEGALPSSEALVLDFVIERKHVQDLAQSILGCPSKP